MIESDYRQRLSEREAAVMYNLGLKKAVYILERADHLSREGRKYLTEALKKEMKESEVMATVRVLEALSTDLVLAGDHDR